MDFNRVNSWTYLLFFLSILFFVTRGELVRLDDIEKVYKKRRHDKDSRLTTVLVNEGHLSTLFFFFCFYIGVRVCVCVCVCLVTQPISEKSCRWTLDADVDQKRFVIDAGRTGWPWKANEEAQTSESQRQHNESREKQKEELYDVETEGQRETKAILQR